MKLLIDSTNRLASSSSASDFRVQLPSDIGIKKNQIRLVKASIPKSWYLIETNYNDSFTIETVTDGAATAVTLSQGSYTATELATELKTKMDAASSNNTYTISYSSITSKFTFVAATENFQFEFASPTTGEAALADILGFNEVNSGLGLTHVSNNKVEFHPEHYVYIKSTLLTSGDCQQSTTGDGHILALVPSNTQNYDTWIVYEPRVPYWQDFEARNQLIIDFRLDFKGNRRVNLQGGEIALEFDLI